MQELLHAHKILVDCFSYIHKINLLDEVGASCDLLGFALLGYYLPTNPKRLQWSSLAAVVGDTTTVPNGCTEEQMSYSNASDPSSNGGGLTSNNDERDEKDDVEAPDGHKMARVCDKLIEVFMVDKPTTRDWRRLLGFSKDWNKIRPHFYKRCQDRADSEDDPGMKHKLLRLGRKLKEVPLYNMHRLICTHTHIHTHLNRSIKLCNGCNDIDSFLLMWIKYDFLRAS